jgi:hypothetical protein
MLVTYEEKISTLIKESQKRAMNGGRGCQIVRAIALAFACEYQEIKDFNISHTYWILMDGFEIRLAICRRFEMFSWDCLDIEWEDNVDVLIDGEIKKWVLNNIHLQLEAQEEPRKDA